MGSDEVHLRGLRELVDEVAKLLSTVSEKSWQSSEIPTDWEGKKLKQFYKEKKEDSGNCRLVSLVSQASLCAQQDHKEGPPGNYSNSCGALSNLI